MSPLNFSIKGRKEREAVKGRKRQKRNSRYFNLLRRMFWIRQFHLEFNPEDAGVAERSLGVIAPRIEEGRLESVISGAMVWLLWYLKQLIPPFLG